MFNFQSNAMLEGKNKKIHRYSTKVRLQHDLLLNLDHKLRGVKNDEKAFGQVGTDRKRKGGYRYPLLRHLL